MRAAESNPGFEVAMVVPPLSLLLPMLLAAPDSTVVPRPDSATALPTTQTRRVIPADTTGTTPPRIVRRFEEFVVRGAPLHDARSSESVHLIPGRLLRSLPADRLSDAVALKAGVVAQGEALHVRGGRAGELSMALNGVTLNEPLRGHPPELPLLAIRSAELVSGGLDAEHGGTLAGVLNLRTVDPDESWGGELLWRTDGRQETSYDRAGARFGGPIGIAGYGVVATAEAQLDDTHLPALRSESRHTLGAASFGWRADNRLLGHLKLAPTGGRRGVSLEVLANRRVDRPYSPMWSLDGWTSLCIDPFCALGPEFSSTPQPGYERYRAADHMTMTDERRLVTVLSLDRPRARDRLSGSLAWARMRSITSLGAGDDESYLVKTRLPIFGSPEQPTSDPYLVYAGDEPYFQKSASDQWTLRGDYEIATPRGSGGKAGLGLTYDAVRLRELDVSTIGTFVDSLRSFRAFAPGGFAYAQGRWVFEGMVLNAGLRGEYFTAGPQAAEQSFGEAEPGRWSLSPRLGVAYPVSVRDVFSLAYVRIQQNPAREFLYDDRIRPGHYRRGSVRANDYRPLGNPGLAPATVVSYQAAVKHLFNARWAMQGAVFYRDLFGMVGARNFVTPTGFPAFRYADADNGHASGWELSLIRSSESRGSLELHYTWMIARGSESLEQGIPYFARTGARPVPIGDHPLDWDRRHTLTLLAWWDSPAHWSLSWSTLLGSGFAWTPATRRQLEADLSRVNTMRFKWEESSALSARWMPPWIGPRLSLGVDVRNVFDYRSDARATLSGYPNLTFNTVYDDYGAFRTETGLGGGAISDDRDNDGVPRWQRIHDPRLLNPPRTVRLSLNSSW